MRISLYILSIVLANVITAALAPINISIFLVPAGTFFIGLTFILRDYVQKEHGKQKTYMVIVGALVLSGLTSFLLGDSLMIVTASAISFALSETTDTEIYSRLKTNFAKRVFVSGTVGGVIDSTVFVIIGLSPIGAGFLDWNMIPLAITGQVIVKTALQVLGAVTISKLGSV